MVSEFDNAVGNILSVFFHCTLSVISLKMHY